MCCAKLPKTVFFSSFYLINTIQSHLKSRYYGTTGFACNVGFFLQQLASGCNSSNRKATCCPLYSITYVWIDMQYMTPFYEVNCQKGFHGRDNYIRSLTERYSRENKNKNEIYGVFIVLTMYIFYFLINARICRQYVEKNANWNLNPPVLFKITS